MSLNNKQCKTIHTLIDLNPNELNYYSFMVSLERCRGSCNTFDDSSRKICVRNKIDHVNVKVFNFITGINDAKKLVRHISCDCKCKVNDKNVIQTKNGIVTSAVVSEKNQWCFLCANDIALGVLVDVFLSFTKSVSLVNI